MHKDAGILLLCIAITSMAAGSSAWHATPNSTAVARQIRIHNNLLNQFVRLLRWRFENDLSEFPKGIDLQKTPLKDNHKIENKDVNKRPVISFLLSRMA